jgi:hypothetical protein
VQRSLNRVLGLQLITDGADNESYRDAIEQFQADEDLAMTRTIDRREQDLLIRLNHASSVYMDWVRQCLSSVGFNSGNDAARIQAFQKALGLTADGWVGARTETAMIWATGKHPPGHQTTPSKPKPKPKPSGPIPSLLNQFLRTDAASARMLVPAEIEPYVGSFPEKFKTDEYIRQRVAAAVRVAQYTQLRLATMAAKADCETIWNDASLERWWFGRYSPQKLEKVLGTFVKIVEHLRDPRLRIICKSHKGGYGNASPGIRKIAIGTAWIYPEANVYPSADGERVQTFVHEAAHISGRVIAVEGNHYGRTAAHGLANNGMRATRNADNYGYYAIDVAMTPR